MTDQPQLTSSDLATMFEELSNWGRWGDDDQRGALNLITPARRMAAVGLVREGLTVSCALELPVAPAPDNPQPVMHLMLAAGDGRRGPEYRGLTGSMDYFAIAPHGTSTTHLDALCHVFVNGKMYNGYDQSYVRSSGAYRDSIMAGRDGIVGRGVLLDIPALRGIDWLEPGERIGRKELEAAAERQDVPVEEGDVLLVGTGRDARREQHGPWSPYEAGLAGLSPDCLPWLHERGVAVLGCDGISDALPGAIEGWGNPVHQIAIPSMGVHLIDNMQLGRLAAQCAELGRWEFLFTMAPLRLERGTASPVNPIALL